MRSGEIMFVVAVGGLLAVLGFGVYRRTLEVNVPRQTERSLDAGPVKPLPKGDVASGGGRVSVSESLRSVKRAPATPIFSVISDELLEVEPEYLPSRESLQYHVSHHLDQIADLKLEYVVTLFEEWPQYLPLTSSGQERFLQKTVAEHFGMPTEYDVDRLWGAPGFQAKFQKFLWLDHQAFVLDEMRWATGDLSYETLSNGKETEAAAAWDELWQTPDLYPHWAFLMEVARRHFR